MRILIDATPLQTGHRTRGVGTYTRELLKALLALDRENEYRLIVHRKDGFASAGDEKLLRRLPANAGLVTLPRPPLGRLAAFASHQMLLPLLLQRERADLFHAPGFVAAFSVPGVPWHCPQPLVVTLHDFIPLHVPSLFNDKAINRRWYRLQMRLARRAARLICVSEATRQDAIHWLQVPPERCVVVHEGVDPEVFHPNHSPRGSQAGTAPPTILFVGGNYPNKNRPAALAAFARLTQATTFSHHLILVGQDTTGDAELASRYPGLDLGRIRRLAHVSQAELAQLYRDADLLLFPSTCEGFGLPVLEAMASGTPVVTSQASSLPEIAGDAALLVAPHDVDALVAAMARALGSSEVRSRLVRAGLRRASQLTWQATAEGTLAVYRQAVA